MKVCDMFQPNIPQWKKYLLKLMASLFVKLLQNRLNVTAKESKRSLENANKIMDEV